jgi:LacI family gluconate utilization system Gnt-I transcriptional repressor
LASGRSNIVAALIPNLSHSIFGETVQALSEGLQGAGFELLLASTGYALDREEEQLRTLLAWAPSALVVTGRHHSAAARQMLLAAHKAGTPVVEIWDYHLEADSPFTQVGFDHREVGKAMAAHLIDNGHRRLAYLDSGVDTDFRAHERGAGFAAEARRRRVQCQTIRAVVGDPFDAGRAAMHTLLGGAAEPATRPAAVACANDHLACGLMMEALANGLAVPADVAVMGFGDFPVGRQLQPALSTVHPPSQEIGRVTAEILTRTLTAGHKSLGACLSWQLKIRSSTRRKV